ncbi:MAG: hypothetical protein ACRD8W_27190 [Nitrososphaeraceae archaeon]
MFDDALTILRIQERRVYLPFHMDMYPDMSESAQRQRRTKNLSGAIGTGLDNEIKRD